MSDRASATQPAPGLTAQDFYLSCARTSLRQLVAQYSNRVRRCQYQGGNANLLTLLQGKREQLTEALDKLERGLIRIAAFGLVSRGKSAVLNALLGQKVLPTGPINGVTQWPRSVHWLPPGGKVQVELIDTPGLDEVNDQARSQMAQQVAQQADLILFVVAGDITRTEYQALCQLRQIHKPLLLVFNKIDLYPPQSCQAICQKLQTLEMERDRDPSTSPPARQLPPLLIAPDEIVMVAADPMPLQVRVEWPDGRITHEWESPPPQIDPLKQKLADLLNRQGRPLLALNALLQARDAEQTVARQTMTAKETKAEQLIWRFARYKALAVALNPIAVLDLLGGAIADLALIRSLAHLYDLPMTSYEASKLLKAILLSSGGLLLGELGSSFILGLGKSGAAISTAIEGSIGLTTYASTALAQATLAGYGSYRIGLAAQIYLQQGCTWGSQGPSTLIQDILNRLESDTILARLKQEIDPAKPGGLNKP